MYSLILSTLAFAQEPTSKDDSGTKEEKKVQEAETKEAPVQKKKENATKKPAKSEKGPKVQVDKVVQDVFPVLYNGQDENTALIRVTASSKIDIEKLKPLTISDMAGGRLPAVLQGGEAINCSGAPISMPRIRMMVQQAENEIAYFELEKAEARLSTANKGLGCLRDTVDPAIASRLHLLRGITAAGQEDSKMAFESYKRAVIFNPTIAWDDYFSPDFRTEFDNAKKSVATLKEIPIRFIPNSSNTMIWLNGIPISTKEEITVTPGEHLVQMDWGNVTSTRIVVEETADSVSLIIPAAVPISAHTWVADEKRREDLGNVFAGMLEPESVVYVHEAGDVYSLTAGQQNWQKLEVPRRFGVDAQNSRYLLGQVGMYGGAAMAIIGGSIFAYNSLVAGDANRKALSTDSFQVYQSLSNAFYSAKDTSNIGAAILFGGAALGASGFLVQYQITK